jgi:hypothetical protein
MPSPDGLILKKLTGAGSITIAGQTYEMSFNLNANCLLEDFYADRGQSLAEVMRLSENKRPLNFYRAAFWAMAKAGGAPFETIEDLGAYIDIHNMPRVVEIVSAAIAKGTVEPGNEENPTIAAAANQ